MDRGRRTKLSKRLAFHLRHDPGAADLTLDPAGWAAVEEVLLRVQGISSHEDLEAIVAGGGKRRFEFSADGNRIRARYGHSVDVDPAHDEVAPPEVLYHGTATRNVERIEREGLRPMGRRRVHLSEAPDDATTVGRRHGEPVVLEVDAGRMHEDGHRFARATDGVWLVDEVPPRYLRGP